MRRLLNDESHDNQSGSDKNTPQECFIFLTLFPRKSEVDIPFPTNGTVIPNPW